MSLTLTREANVAPLTGSSNNRPSLLARLVAAIAREIQIRRDMRVLASFDDAALHDIGLARGGMEDVVRHGRPRKQSLPTLERLATDPTNTTILPLSLTEWR